MKLRPSFLGHLQAHGSLVSNGLCTGRSPGVLSKAFGLSLGLAAVNIASASDWAGGTGNWNSIVSPGWTVGGVPNTVGAVANFGTGTSNGTTTQDIVAGVTVGTLSYSITANQNRTITLTNALTLNQDGAGSGTATISNSNATTTTTAGALNLSAGTLTLADNLLITNTGSNANTTGAIQILSTIGGTGNIELSNTGTSQNATTGAGAIRLDGTNTFTGTVTVSKGLTTFNNASAFGGAAGNTITLGSSGQNATLLLISNSAATIVNNWVGSSRVDLQACKLEYSIVSPK